MKENTRDKRIYLAGHTGLVGSAIYRALLRRGYQNILVRTHADLDLTNQAATRAFIQQAKPEVVIVAAARVGGIMANWTYPYEFCYENLAIELNVIDAALRAGVKRLIFLGSSCIYPRLAPQPLREEYLLTGPLEETNRPYALAKIAGIELCRSLNREYGTKYISLMPTNLYGPGDNFDLETSHVLPALIRKFHEAKVAAAQQTGAGRRRTTPVVLWGSGQPRREFLYVDDLAEAVCVFVEDEEAGNEWMPDGIINVGTGDDLTIKETAELVRRVIGHNGPIEWDTTKPDGTPQKVLDVTRIKNLGWTPQVSLEEGIKRTYEWFLAEVVGKVASRA